MDDRWIIDDTPRGDTETHFGAGSGEDGHVEIRHGDNNGIDGGVIPTMISNESIGGLKRHHAEAHLEPKDQ